MVLSKGKAGLCLLTRSRPFSFQDCLQPLSMQALPAQPESLCIVEMGGVEKQDELGEKGTIGFLYLNIGLQVGRPHCLHDVGSSLVFVLYFIHCWNNYCKT